MRAPLRPTAGTRLAAAALGAVLLLATSACTKESDRAADPATTSAQPTGTVTPSGTPSGTPSPGATGYRTFGADDYTYRLEVLCFCPQVGTVEVVVRDGAVAEATVVDGPRAGTPAPEFTRLTIDDILARAHEPSVAKSTIAWPDDADHPRSVMIDRIAQGVDDEVTYTIEDVRIP